MWTQGAGLVGWSQPRMSTQLLFPAGLAPPRYTQGQVLRSVCSSPSSFLSKAQLSLQLGGGKDGGQSPGPRLQPGFTVRGQRSREAGAPSQQAFMRHYTPSLSYSGPAPLPLRSSQCPAPRVHLGGHSGVTPASALVHGPSGPTCILGHFPSCPILLILVLILSISEATLGRAIG